MINSNKYQKLSTYAGNWRIVSTDNLGRVDMTIFRVYYANCRFTFDISPPDGGAVILPCGKKYYSYSKRNDSVNEIEEDCIFDSLTGVTLCFAFWLPGLLRPSMVSVKNPTSQVEEFWKDDGLLRKVSYSLGDKCKVECCEEYQITQIRG